MLLLWQRFILNKLNLQLYMKIYDTFMFFDEEMLLDLRLNILNKYVDKFVITEASYMHSGKSKKLIFLTLHFDIKFGIYAKIRDYSNL